MGKRKFNYAKLELLLKLSINRAVIHRNKRREQSAKAKQDVADLLESNKEALARIRTVAIVHGDYLVEVFSSIIIHAQTLVQRLEVLKLCSEKETCPPAELKPACCALVYAAPYLESQDELKKVRLMLIKRFGARFPEKCVEEGCVGATLVKRLSKKRPPEDLIEFYMESIATKHGVDWKSPLEFNRASLNVDDAPGAAADHPASSQGGGDLSSVGAASSSFESNEIPGRVYVDRARGNMWVKHAHQRNFPLVFVAPGDGNGAQHGDDVLVGLLHRDDGRTQGIVTNVIGKHTNYESNVTAMTIGAASGIEQEGSAFDDTSEATVDAKMMADPATGNVWAVEVTDPSQPLIYVASKDLNGGGTGDVVRIALRPRPDGKRQGRVESILHRASQVRELEAQVVLDPKTGHHWAVELVADPSSSSSSSSSSLGNKRPVFLPPSALRGARPGDHVVVQACLPEPGSKKAVAGRVLRVTARAAVQGVLRIQGVQSTGDRRAPGGSATILGSVAVDSTVASEAGNGPQGPVAIGGSEILICDHHFAGARDGDRVLVQPHLTPGRAADFVTGGSSAVDELLTTGEIVRVLERAPVTGRLNRPEAADGPSWAANALVLVDWSGGTPLPPSERVVYIPQADLNGAGPDDRVRVQIAPGFRDGQMVGRVLAVEERGSSGNGGEHAQGSDQVAAEIVIDPKTGHCWARKTGPNFDGLPPSSCLVFVAPKDRNGAANNDLVTIALHNRPDGKQSGRVTAIIRRFASPSSTEGVAAVASKPSTSDGVRAPGLVHVQRQPSARAFAHSAAAVQMSIDSSLSSAALSSGRPRIVVDIGSGSFKCGLAGEELPRCAFPTVVGRPKFKQAMAGAGEGLFVGDDAQAKRGILSLSYPVNRGVIENWDDVEALWAHAMFNELRADPRDAPLLMAEPPAGSRDQREKLAELAFERFGVPSLYIAAEGPLALRAAGLRSGVVLDVGDGVSHVSAVHQGRLLPQSTQRLNLGGRDVTLRLAELLRERTGAQFARDTLAVVEVARQAKERFGYVAAQPDAELARSQADPAAFEHAFELPDGNVIGVGDEAFRCAELLFKPEDVGRDEKGVASLLAHALGSAPADARPFLAGNIVLSGGSTLLPGFGDRLLTELGQLVPEGAQSRLRLVDTGSERRFLVWSGGSQLASTAEFPSVALSKQSFEEHGRSIVHTWFKNEQVY